MTISTSLDEPRPREPLTAYWDREWGRLQHAPSTTTVLARWRAEEPHLAPYSSLAEILEAARSLPGADADAILAALIRRAPTDEVATHLVLRRVLHGILRATLRRAATGRWRARPLFSEMVGMAWIVIRTYRLDRRPDKIAVNILCDAEYGVCVQPYRLLSNTERLVGSATELLGGRVADVEGLPEGQGRHAADELAAVLAAGRDAGLSSDDMDLLHSLYLEAEPVQAAAARLGVTPRTILNRRLAATERLRRAAA
jgi:hypothetical protein